MTAIHQEKSYFRFLWTWPFVATALVLAIQSQYLLVSGLLYFLVPSIYLSWKYPQYIPKVFTISALMMLTLGVPFEYIVEINREYVVPVSVFGDFRILGYVTLDVLLWGLAWIYFAVIFYETSSNHGKHPRFIAPQFKNLVFVFGLFLVSFFGLYAISPDLVRIPYFYFIFGITAIAAPLIIILYRFPKLRRKFLFTSTYFAVVYFLHEITSVYLGQWFFPTDSRVLGHLNLGGVILAHEEWIFFILLSAPVIAAYYEYFDDDQK